MTDQYDAAAGLARLAAWIDAQLEDETAGRQYIAERASAGIKDITLAMLGARERAAVLAPPIGTEQEAMALRSVRAVYRQFDADPGRGKMAQPNRRILTEACAAAGVELGAFDEFVLTWLAGWNPATCAVVAGIITRAAAGSGAR